MVALALVLAAAAPYDPAISTSVFGRALGDGAAWSRLEDLTDTIGPRLSGSPGADAAVRWGLARFREDGLAARLEPVKVPHWVRGEERGEIVATDHNPTFPMAITALGGSVPTPAGGTNGEIVEVTSLEEVAQLGDKVKGRIVFFNHTMGTKGGYGEWAELRGKGPAAAGKAGAIGALVRSLATASLRSPHTGMTSYGESPKVPAAAISVEDAELIHRLLQRGPVRVRYVLGCRTLPDADSANVVADVRGREAPDEIVLLGAHLDSWDLAQGAEDDGAGVAIVMEAGRILAKLPRPPRRTVRVVLFMNEENGLAGGKGYAKAHEGELDKHVAAIEMDAGGGKPVGVVMRSPGGPALLKDWLTPLATLGMAEPAEGEAGGADTSPMKPFSVPMVNVQQEGSKYFELHHSAADTLDHLKQSDIAQSAAALAWVAYALAEMPQRLPRPPAAEAHNRIVDEPKAH